jgi:hypothetical protein
MPSPRPARFRSQTAKVLLVLFKLLGQRLVPALAKATREPFGEGPSVANRVIARGPHLLDRLMLALTFPAAVDMDDAVKIGRNVASTKYLDRRIEGACAASEVVQNVAWDQRMGGLKMATTGTHLATLTPELTQEQARRTGFGCKAANLKKKLNRTLTNAAKYLLRTVLPRSHLWRIIVLMCVTPPPHTHTHTLAHAHAHAHRPPPLLLRFPFAAAHEWTQQ